MKRGISINSEFVQILDRFKNHPNVDALKKQFKKIIRSGLTLDQFREKYIEALISGEDLNIDPEAEEFFVSKFDITEPDMVLKHQFFYENMFEELGVDITMFGPNTHKVIDDILHELPQRTEKILKTRWGYENDEKCTYAKIAEMFGLTPARVREITNKGIRILSFYKHTNDLKDEMKNCTMPVEYRTRFIREFFAHRDIFQNNSNEPLEEDVRKRLLEIFEFGTSESRSDEKKKIEDMPILASDLSNNARSALIQSGINTLGQLIQRNRAEIGNIKNVGRKLSKEIYEFVERYGLLFADEVPKEIQRKQEVPESNEGEQKEECQEDRNLQFLITSIVDAYSSIIDEKNKNEEANKQLEKEIERILKEIELSKVNLKELETLLKENRELLEKNGLLKIIEAKIRKERESIKQKEEEEQGYRATIERNKNRNQTIDGILKTLDADGPFDLTF